MAAADDIALIIAQEQRLAFTQFDEATAFAIGTAIRDRALAENLSLVVDVRLWNRPLFYAAMPGTDGDNQHWVRRKANTVQRLLKSSYRVVLEQAREDRQFAPSRAMDTADYALAGGGFPIRMAGLGPIGCVTVSGLKERADHQVAVDGVMAALGLSDPDLILLPQ
ncbi:heme-degrading domain-containing protein [Devosia sp.]|uniref:heme-degrading domain-containing protein n=1 Tax=Devosia sp. TaxID=1871048 RepID=UPI003A943576